MKVKAKIVKTFHHFEEGSTHSFQKATFDKLVKKGLVEKSKGGRPKKEEE